MKTVDRICIEDYTVTDSKGESFTVQRGQEYTTSTESEGTVVVFSRYWVKVPARIFAGAVPEQPDWKLLYERAEDMLLRVEWVRQASGNKYACAFCGGIADRDGGPGHTDDCAWTALVVRRLAKGKV